MTDRQLEQVQATLPFAVATPEIVPVESRGLPLEEQFKAFHEANPGVYDALKRLALEAKQEGWWHGSISLLFERLRWLYAVKTRGSKYKLNNNWRAFYARRLMDNEPQLADWFDIRTQHAVERNRD